MTERAIERRILPLAWALLAAACASSSGATKPTPAPEAAPKPTQTPAHKTPATPGAAAEPNVPRMTARAERLFGDAVQAYQDQKKLKVPTDWQALELKWRAVIEAEEVPEAYFNLGVVLEHQHRSADARAAYARALELKPSLHQAALNLAVLAEGDDPRAAATGYIELLQRFPEDAGARVRLASLYLGSGQLDESWRLSREALQRDPHQVGAYKVMMRIALRRGNPDLAELIALRAQKLDGVDPEVAFFVGQIRAKQEDENGAVQQYRKALTLRDDYLPARYELLRVATRKQLWEQVAEQSRAILRIDGSDARVHLSLGIALRYLNQPDKALEEYDQAEKLSGNKLPEVHLARGVLLMKAKNVCEPAITEFKQYVTTAPALAADAQVFKLQRECEQIVTENRKAEEEVRRMKAEEDQKKSEQELKKKQEEERKAAAEAAKNAPAPVQGRPAEDKSDAPAPIPAPEKKVPPPAGGKDAKGAASAPSAAADDEPPDPR